MPYVARHLICHPRFNCHQGKKVVGCPPDLLAQFLKDGVIRLEAGEDGEEDIPSQLIEDQDVLSPLSQKELVSVIMLNGLRGLCKPMSNWSLDQIRQCIRDATGDVNKLKLPGDKLLIVEELNGPDLSGTDPDEAKRFAS